MPEMHGPFGFRLTGTEAIGGGRNALRDAVRCFLVSRQVTGKQLFPKRKRLEGGSDSAELIPRKGTQLSRITRWFKGRPSHAWLDVIRPRNLPSREKAPVAKTQTSINGGGEVVLYEAPDGEVRLDVRLEQETVWLTQRQMATLFETTPENVLMHLKNVYGEGELVETGTTKDFLAVRTEGRRRVRRKLKHYNLDAIISVGYRVNSKRGVRFRQWATGVLREHIVKGYTLNAQRLAERGVDEIEQAVGLLARTLTQHALVTDEGRAVLEVVQQYTRAWRLLLQYDENRLPDAPEGPVKPTGGANPIGCTRRYYRVENIARGTR